MLHGQQNIKKKKKTKITGTVGANGEAALNNCKTLTHFCTWNNLKIMDTFVSISNKFSWEARGHKSIAIL